MLCRKVITNKADFGFIVDPDADRCRFVDENGNIVDNSYMHALVIKYLLKKHKEGYIVRELTARKIIPDTIKKYGGTDVMSKVGHPYIIDLMNKYKAVYGCEMSGHNFFKDMYNLDSAEMMIITVINMYTSSGKKLSTLWKPLDKYVYLGELTYKLNNDSDKIIIIDNIKKHFENKKKKYSIKKILEIDGISIIAKNFWFNIRPSNTEQILRFRIEGKKGRELQKIRREVERIINE